MKFVKVRHRRMAVGHFNSKNNKKLFGGFVYAHPYKKDENTDIQELVQNRQKEAANLYHVLNGCVNIYDSNTEKEKQELAEQVIKEFNSLFGKNMNNHGIFKNEKASKDYVKIRSVIKSYMEQNNGNDIGKKINQTIGSDENLLHQFANEVVSYSLRKSLRIMVPLLNSKDSHKVSMLELVKNIFYAIVIKPDAKMEYVDALQNEIVTFVHCTYRDKIKSMEYQEKLANSLLKQNVKVQVFEKELNGKKEKLLMLSNHEHEKKRYVVDFIKEFVGKGKEDQNLMILHIKELIVLYLYGEKKVLTFNNSWERFAESEQEGINFFDTVKSEDFSEMNRIFHVLEVGNAQEQKVASREFERYLRLALCLKYKNTCVTDMSDHSDVNNNITNMDVYWIKFFGQCMEKYGKHKRKSEYYRCDRLCNFLWQSWMSHVASKFIALGKALYYFGIPRDIYIKTEFEIGSVLKEYENGITSFDYERIKAEETLIRNIATSITHAANNFANAVVSKEYRFSESDKNSLSDVLSYTRNVLNKNLISNFKKRFLMYFGGASLWNLKDNDWDMYEMKEHLAAIRNTSYHFSTNRKSDQKRNNTFAKKLLAGELEYAPTLIIEKYISNNLTRFYDEKLLYGLMCRLYSGTQTPREAQIPSFHAIMNRNDVFEFLNQQYLGETEKEQFKNVSDRDIYVAAMNFLLKEIYYHDFLKLSSPQLIEKFVQSLIHLKTENKKEGFAKKNFVSRCAELGILTVENNGYIKSTSDKCKITFGEFCQQIMTDYNMQNQNQKEIPSLNKQRKNKKNGLKPVYEHFVMLLRRTIREAFLYHLKNAKKYKFLRHPKMKQSSLCLSDFMGKIEKNSDNKTISIYGNLKELIQEETVLSNDNQVMYDWYIAGHFLPPKQLNLLIGDLRTYISYSADIWKRASDTQNSSIDGEYIKKETKMYQQILCILEFVLQFVGKTSKKIEDYFGEESENIEESHEAYARYIAQFVDFENTLGKNSDLSYVSRLKEFSNSKMECTNSTDKALRLYYDNENPIVNRNIVYSLLYGDSDLLSSCMEKVSLEEIAHYYQLRDQLSKQGVFKNSKCTSKEQLELLREFQNLKNRIELLDVQTYTELVQDVMSQLVSWAYLRERDCLYFCLGYHYIELYYGDTSHIKKQYQYLEGNNIRIFNGALLYQILAIFDHALPLYKVNDEGKVEGKVENATIGTCLKTFVSDYCHEEYKTGRAETYNAGLDFFGSENARDGYAYLRNYIAHMKWYSMHDKNIWELFGQMYNGFLNYDIKLKKSVSFIFKNLLERYFVVAKTYMKHSDGSNPFLFSGKLSSDQFVYYYYETEILDKKTNTKRMVKKKAAINARSELFLKQLDKLLNYKQEK